MSDELELPVETTADLLGPVFTIFGTHGSIIVNLNTFRVVCRNPPHGADGYTGGYNGIDTVDLNEWRDKYETYPAEGSEHDILDFGYWGSDNSYSEPAHAWREELRMDSLSQEAALLREPQF